MVSFPLAWQAGVAEKAVVKRGGELFAELDLSRNREIEVPGPLGLTRIAVEKRRVRVVSDPGPRQYCVRQGWLKRAVNSELIYPRFSILNPELAFTLPPFQVACGAMDISAHLMERYFTNVKNVSFTDRLIEGTLKTIMRQAPRILANPQDYDAWSEFMWAGTIAHNNLLNTGRIGDWASHDIEHEISGIYDVAHGAGLAVVFPAWMKHVLHQDLSRFVQWAVRVWNVEMDVFNPEKVALEGIARMEAFIRSLGIGTKLVDLGITDDRIDEMADKCTNGDTTTVGNFVKLDRAAVAKILRLAV